MNTKGRKDIPGFEEKLMENNYKILIVEDDPISYYLIKEILGLSPDIIMHKEDGKEALDFLQKEHHQVVLIIMDIILPQKDGITTIKAIREKTWNIPIIAMSADVNEINQNRCYEAGCDIFLPKPFNIEKFQTAISGFISIKA